MRQSVTGALILLNVAVFVLQGVAGDALLVNFALWPLGRFEIPELHATVGFQPWQLLTSSLLHGGFAHIFLNMFALHMFGRSVEATLGPRRFLWLYVSAVLAAALVQLAVVSWAGGRLALSTVGASGGVFGVLLAFGMLFPRQRVVLLFPPIPMPAWVLVTVYGLIELASGIFGTLQGVAHFAHLGGMLGAYAVLRHWRARDESAP